VRGQICGSQTPECSKSTPDKPAAEVEYHLPGPKARQSAGEAVQRKGERAGKGRELGEGAKVVEGQAANRASASTGVESRAASATDSVTTVVWGNCSPYIS
jgi:hypothetical protein